MSNVAFATEDTHDDDVLHHDDENTDLVMTCVHLKTPIMTGSYIMMTTATSQVRWLGHWTGKDVV